MTTLLRQDASPTHTADFGDGSLRARVQPDLLEDPHGTAGTTPRATTDLDRLLAMHVAARRTPRFFCLPERVAGVIETLERVLPGWAAALTRDAERLTGSHLPVYAAAGPALDGHLDWDALPAGPGDDLLYPVRIHRFAFVPRLALAVVRGALADDRLLAFLDRWMALAASGDSDRPYCSTLVVTQRLLALTWAVHFLVAGNDGRRHERLLAPMLRIIAEDVHFLLPRVGQSVDNNHLLVDYFAGWFVAAVWPEFVPRARGIASATPAWERELLRQTYADGGGFEHCMHYHEFACEMAVCYVLWSRCNDVTIAPHVTARIERMLHFQHELAGRLGVPFPLGDAAEDPMLALDDAGGWASGSLSILYREIFGGPVDDVRSRDAGVERAVWMLAGELSKCPTTDAPADAPTMAGERFVGFPDSGVYAMHEPGEDAALLFRTGPAPAADLFAGHMHADFMSVFLRVDRQPVIEDAGTYTYSFRAATHGIGWRRYLMGPQAHNGLVLDDVDPLGEVVGAFRPRALSARVESTTGGAADALTWVAATLLDAGPYSGWSRLVVHVPGRYWLVIDDTAGVEHGAARSFHLQFAPSLRVCVREGATHVEAGNGEPLAAVRPWNCAAAELHEAGMDPVAGWVSPRYGELVPACQARHALDADRDLSAFVITAGRLQGSPPRVDSVERIAGGYRVSIDAHDHEDLLLLDVQGSGAPMRSDTLTFRGGALWLRTDHGRPVALRCIDGQALDAPGMNLTTDTLVRAGETGRARTDGHEVTIIDW